jgi:hypothetical protein
MRRLAVAILMMLVVSWNAPRAIQTNMDLRAIDEALILGRTAIERERARFHEPYRLKVGRAPVDYIELVTPFRRIVLAVQERAALGDRGFGQRQAIELLASAEDQLDVYAELTFHPLNTYIGVPDYEVALMAGKGIRLDARAIDRLPRWTPRGPGLPPAVATPTGLLIGPPGQPLIGGTVIARFDVRALDAKGTYDVIVSERGEERARATGDVGKLR